jgi:Plasmid replication region DNA-binding N-term
MSRPALHTYEQFCQAADQLAAEGGSVTFAAMRQKLGGGGFQTLGRYMRRWRGCGDGSSSANLSDRLAKVSAREAAVSSREESVNRLEGLAIRRHMEVLERLARIESCLSAAPQMSLFDAQDSAQ